MPHNPSKNEALCIFLRNDIIFKRKFYFYSILTIRNFHLGTKIFIYLRIVINSKISIHTSQYIHLEIQLHIF